MEKSCSLLIHFDKGTPALDNEIKEALEGNDFPAKIDAMKKAVMLLLNGETLPQLFITIIRYVLPSEDHTIEKLLLLYLEIIEKTDSKGRVLPEMILICQNLRNNLQHPNEYLCGATFRFLCRLNEDKQRGEREVYQDYYIILVALLRLTYECASTLVSLSSAPSAIRAAANTYCQLLQSQSENNVKLIILDRLNESKSSHKDVMVDMIMDVLRALSSPNLDIRRKTLDIVLELITPRNINEVVLTLKKEVVKTQSGELEKNGEYL
ncbi:hypothetical protein K7X08_012670 [Anisodus acutangulus]|uniref:Clathrin/coatomer adaptor adaptin-like N-terminal domain-containing protein n=1 Tax=Anisodus acutangulus TaxID=402998 RepID=A0A9Q1MCZ3_9SOLA|nr:hypothetical protein K7X08_012670 [Anisodus acutangulus]